MRLGGAADPIVTLGHAARPMLRELAITVRGTAHLGVLEADRQFTEEGKQLEAYCSGIGKMLLADLPTPERGRYLANGPFTALTDRTITDPALLRIELARTRERGYAVDDAEIAPAIWCVAAPLLWPDGVARAAISLTRVAAPQHPADIPRLAATLQATAAALIALVFGCTIPEHDGL